MANKRILIVEDEAITGMVIRAMVQDFGYRPYGPVITGEAAITSALALRPDVILMDIMLKGPMDGIQAAEVIRSQHRCAVIYLTGSSDQFRDRHCEPYGMVLKPVGEQALHGAIETALYGSGTVPEEAIR